MNGSQTQRDPLRLGIAALVAAMAADLAETLVDPANSGDATRIYDAALHHHGAMVLSAGLLLLSSAAIVPSVRGIVRSLGGRARVIGGIAQAFALLGAIGHGALAGAYLLWASIPGSGASRGQLIPRRDVRCGGSGEAGAGVGAGCGRRGDRVRGRPSGL